MADAKFVVQIKFDELIYNAEGKQIEKRQRVLMLDAVEDISTNATNTITTHPIVSGDIVADHSYKNPITMSLSGTAALFGHQGIVVDNKGITLADLQELLLKLKDNAYLCDIIKFSIDNKKDIRFKHWSNMVITGLSMTERINTLQYSISWQQVMLAEVQTTDIDFADEYLPNVTEPMTTSFTDALIDWEQIDVMVYKMMKDNNLIKDNFEKFLSGLGATWLVSAGLAAAALIISALATNPVGWVILAVAAIAVFAYGIYKAFEGLFNRKKYRIKTFEAYNDDRKNQQEVERFNNFFSEIHKQLQLLNNVIQVYQISSDEDQECLLSISNNYYLFTFTTNNTTHKRECVITDATDSSQQPKVYGTVRDVSAMPTNYNACTVDNALFRAAETGYYVYLLYPGEPADFKLSDCFIVVSQIKPEDYTKALNDIIYKALVY